MKLYAVKEGRNPGIYETWEECKEQVHNYSGAVFKSFESKEEAERYLSTNQPQEINDALPYAYIDGSYSKKNSCYGWGGYISSCGEIHIIQGKGNASDYLKYRNITGEVKGTLEVITMAISLGISEINLYFDYAGIEQWANQNWTCKNALSQFYQRYYLQMCSQVKINFCHVKGHTGVEGNEIADLLAKEAVGADLRKKDISLLQEFRKKGATQ